MFKQALVIAGAAVLAALIVVAVMDRPATAQAAGGDAVGKYQVVGSGSAFILYETGGPNSWVAFPVASDKKFAWFPLKRLDTDQQVQMWKVGKSSE